MTTLTGKNFRDQPSIHHPHWALCIKRLLDIFISTTILLFIWPMLIIIALAIKLTSHGPVFYRGLRTGLEWSTFSIFKFRTMVPDAELRGGPTTGTNDPRVTTVGFFLRKTKLDELPQFINVFWGDMSLVGPRPEVLEYTRQYQGEEQIIMLMRPGITDYASIEFADLDDKVGTTDPDAYFKEHILPRKNELRVQYVKNWSLAKDFIILWRTFLRILQKIFKK